MSTVVGLAFRKRQDRFCKPHRFNFERIFENSEFRAFKKLLVLQKLFKVCKCAVSDKIKNTDPLLRTFF